MSPITVKYSPAIQDRTLEQPTFEEGWEAVLYEKQEDDHPLNSDPECPLVDASDDESADSEIVSLIKEGRWEELLEQIIENPDIVSSPHAGFEGHLVLHEVCKNGAPDQVIKMILDSYPAGARMAEKGDRMLPLHFACKRGASRVTLMSLLALYPGAVSIHDDFGRTPIDYARSIRAEDAREIAISCLAMGPWVLSAAEASKKKTDLECETQIQDLERVEAENIATLQAKIQELERVQTEDIIALKTNHEEEKAALQAKIQEIERVQTEDIFALKTDHEEEKAAFIQEYARSTIALKTEYGKATKEFMNTKESLEAKIVHQETKIEALESEAEIQNCEHNVQIETERQKVVQIQVELDEKVAELNTTSAELDEVLVKTETTKKHLEDKEADFTIALDEVDRLTNRLKKLDSLMTSIRHLSETEKAAQEGSDVRDAAPEDFRLAFSSKIPTLAKTRGHCKQVEFVFPSSKSPIVDAILSTRSQEEACIPVGKFRNEDLLEEDTPEENLAPSLVSHE